MEHTERTRRPLLRNPEDGRIAGVAAGLGDYFGVDPVLIRLGFLLAILAGGLGLIAYFIAWVVIPTGKADTALQRSDPARPRGTRWLLGAVLVGAGLLVLVAPLGAWWPRYGLELWPLLLVAAGAALVLWRRDDAGAGGPAATGSRPAGPSTDDPGTGPGGSDPTGEATTDIDRRPTADSEPDAVDEPTASLGGRLPVEEEGEETQPIAEARTAHAELDETQALASTFSVRAAPPPAPGPRPAPHRRRYPLGPLALGAIVVSGAVAALLDATGALDVSVTWFLVYALGLSGAALIASGWLGRARGPLALATVLAVAVTFAVVVDVPLRGGIGERTVRPQSLAELGVEQRLGIGRLVIDLRELSLAGRSWRMEAGVGVGELVVLLPPGVETRVDGSARLGEVELFDREENGVHVAASWGGGSAYSPGTIALDLEVGVGKVVTRYVPQPPPGGSL